MVNKPNIENIINYFDAFLNPSLDGFKRVNVSNAKKQKVGEHYNIQTKAIEKKYSYFDLEDRPKEISIFTISSAYLTKRFELKNPKRTLKHFEHLFIIENFFDHFKSKKNSTKDKSYVFTLKEDFETFKEIFNLYDKQGMAWQFCVSRYAKFVTSKWPETLQRAAFNFSGKFTSKIDNIKPEHIINNPEVYKVMLQMQMQMMEAITQKKPLKESLQKFSMEGVTELTKKVNPSSMAHFIDSSFPSAIDDIIKDGFWPPEMLRRFLKSPERYNESKQLAIQHKGYLNFYYNEWLNDSQSAPDITIEYFDRNDEIKTINPKEFCKEQLEEIKKNQDEIKQVI